MIKNIAPVIVLLLLFSCKQKPARKVETVIKMHSSKAIGKQQYANAALNKYAAFVRLLDSNDMETSQKAAKEYTVLFNRQNSTVCDTGFIIFSMYYDKLNVALDNYHQKDTSNFDKYLVQESKQPMPAKMTAYINKLQANGFNFVEDEGATYVEQNRDFITKWFYRYLTPTMREYLMQVNIENKNIYMGDGSIIIKPEELVERTIWWEDFAKTHTSFISTEQAKNIAENYLTLLFEGCDNTPVIDYDTKSLSPFFKDVYTVLVKRYPSSDAGKLAIPYYQLLLDDKHSAADSLLKTYTTKGFINN